MAAFSELDRIMEEVPTAYFTVLSQNLAGEAEGSN
jgi:hypothetical protein